MKANKRRLALALALAEVIIENHDYDLKFDLDVVIPETSASSIHTLAGIAVDDKTKTIMAFIL